MRVRVFSGILQLIFGPAIGHHVNFCVGWNPFKNRKPLNQWLSGLWEMR